MTTLLNSTVSISMLSSSETDVASITEFALEKNSTTILTMGSLSDEDHTRYGRADVVAPSMGVLQVEDITWEIMA